MELPPRELHRQRMPRRKRSYAPGAVFHLTGRTSNKEFWLTNDDVRNEAVAIIGESLLRTDAELIAYSVMTNHLHLLIRQGLKPLAAFAQPVFRRLALRVQRKLGREGHIFKGSYYDGRVDNVEHLRTAIDYIHHNPVDAKMCKCGEEYAWSSCAFYTGTNTDHLAPKQPKLHVALEIFATRVDRTTEGLHADYRKFVKYQADCRALEPGAAKPRAPTMRAGEELYVQRFGTRLKIEPVERTDLADIVKSVLRQMAPTLPLEMLLLRRGGRAIAAVRGEVVRRAMLCGHRGVAIANYLNISPSTVSHIAAKQLGRPELREIQPSISA